jgi:hypothetical protein
LAATPEEVVLAYQKARRIEGLAHPSAYVPHALATGSHADADADARWLRDADADADADDADADDADADDADADARWLRRHSRLLR